MGRGRHYTHYNHYTNNTEVLSYNKLTDIFFNPSQYKLLYPYSFIIFNLPSQLLTGNNTVIQQFDFQTFFFSPRKIPSLNENFI